MNTSHQKKNQKIINNIGIMNSKYNVIVQVYNTNRRKKKREQYCRYGSNDRQN